MTRPADRQHSASSRKPSRSRARPRSAHAPAEPAAQTARVEDRCRDRHPGGNRRLRRARRSLTRRAAAGDRPAPETLAARQHLLRRLGVLVSLAVGLWTDQLDSRPVCARRLAGLAGRRHGRHRRAGACGHPGPRIPGDRPPRRGRKAAEAGARCDRPRRSQGGTVGRRRTVGLRRGQARDRGRPARAGRTARRDHRRRQSGAAGRSRNPRTPLDAQGKGR